MPPPLSIFKSPPSRLKAILLIKGYPNVPLRTVISWAIRRVAITQKLEHRKTKSHCLPLLPPSGKPLILNSPPNNSQSLANKKRPSYRTII